MTFRRRPSLGLDQALYEIHTIQVETKLLTPAQGPRAEVFFHPKPGPGWLANAGSYIATLFACIDFIPSMIWTWNENNQSWFCWHEGTWTHISYTNTWHAMSDTQILFRVILGFAAFSWGPFDKLICLVGLTAGGMAPKVCCHDLATLKQHWAKIFRLSWWRCLWRSILRWQGFRMKPRSMWFVLWLRLVAPQRIFGHSFECRRRLHPVPKVSH